MGTQNLAKAIFGYILIQLLSAPNSGAALIFDNRLSQTTKKIIIQDIDRVSKMGIQNISSETLYAKTFGTAGDINTIKYLSKRIHYIVPSNIKYTDFTSKQSNKLNSKFETLATNISLNLFIMKLINLPNQLFFNINDTNYPIKSIRIGVLGASTEYIQSSSQIDRISTLIHEARHSDCIKPFTKNDIKQIGQGKNTNNLNCGFLHSVCPKGHPYESYPACDNNVWGSYSIEAIYAAALLNENNCPNCSEAERSVAKMLVIDGLSRVINWKSLNGGEYGPPNMN